MLNEVDIIYSHFFDKFRMLRWDSETSAVESNSALIHINERLDSIRETEQDPKTQIKIDKEWLPIEREGE